MGLFRIRPSAWREINSHLDYFEEDAGLATAERFLDQLMGSFQRLAEMPKLGVSCGFKKTSMRRLRRWRVNEFENWLIFYQVTRYGVEIVSVVHGARDIDALFKK